MMRLTRDLARVLGRLTLRVGEVGGDGDDRLGDLLAEILFRIVFELGQDHCGDLLRGVLLAVDLHSVIAAHLSFYGYDGMFGVGDRLTFCDLTHKPLAVLGERHDGRGGAHTFGIRDDDGFAALHDCHTAVGCSEVYTYNLSHNGSPFKSLCLRFRGELSFLFCLFLLKDGVYRAFLPSQHPTLTLAGRSTLPPSV